MKTDLSPTIGQQKRFFEGSTILWLILLLSLSILTTPALGDQFYRFERVWPTLQQPWYFDAPNGIAVNREGHVFVADTENNAIKKLTADGHLVTEWPVTLPHAVAIDADGDLYVAGGNSMVVKYTGDGEFLESLLLPDHGFPAALAIGVYGDLYIADNLNHRVLCFDRNWVLQNRWGGQGSGDGEFDTPIGIAAAPDGFVYVTDSANHRVQKFKPDGRFLKSWGTEGKADGDFQEPAGIAIRDGVVYVVDMLNDRVQCFDTDGVYLFEWGGEGSGEGQFYAPTGIALTPSGYLYVADRGMNRIQKFTFEGRFLSSWGSHDGSPGKFERPRGISIDRSGQIYISDANNYRIQVFDADGSWQSSWGEAGDNPGELDTPYGVAVDSRGDLYVSDTRNHRIQKIEIPNGTVKIIGRWGAAEGEFKDPAGIAVDQQGFLYVADWENSRIQKFDSEGEFIREWRQTGEDVLKRPMDVAVDEQYVYVADTDNGRIVRFDKEGVYQGWEVSGEGGAILSLPTGVAVDSEGNVYGADNIAHRILKFDAGGALVTVIGEFGTGLGQLNNPTDVAVGTDGRLYVSDTGNNRIQVFRETDTEPDRSKAIIVAGGGSFPGNLLWDATRACAHFAYRTLNYRGFTRETIYFLSEDTNPDLDNNGVADDVDAIPEANALRKAITEWAADANDLTLYLVDHGGDGTFRLSGDHILSAAELDAWLDALQAETGCRVILIYDACRSGSFLPALVPPAGAERIVMASAAADESAYFVTHGSVSFSGFFWTEIFSGATSGEAFDRAALSITLTTGNQHPVMDDNGDGIFDRTDGALARTLPIGIPVRIRGEGPTISQAWSETGPEGGNSAIIHAEGVHDPDGVARVWAVIRPPGHEIADPDKTVRELPSVELLPVPDTQGEYAGEFDRITAKGPHQIIVYARDRLGNTSDPAQADLQADGSPGARAVIIAGGAESDPLWPSTAANAKLCHETLRFQGYDETDIRLLTPNPILEGADEPAGAQTAESAIAEWGAGARSLLVFLAGDMAGGSLTLNTGARISAEQLSNWLNRAQEKIPGPVIVILEGPQSGSLIPHLKSGSDENRILISSTGDLPQMQNPAENLSFSRFFWPQIANGANIYTAFVRAKNAAWYAQLGAPRLDDDGNGVWGEETDGQFSRSVMIGAGVQRSGAEPILDQASDVAVLEGGITTEIRIENVTDTDAVDRVWAVIRPPRHAAWKPEVSRPAVDLIQDSDGYSTVHDGFGTYGIYQIAVYAEDESGNIGDPVSLTVRQSGGDDPFEPDDEPESAGVISPIFPDTSDALAGAGEQHRNFGHEGDSDWVKFYAVSGQTYEIRTEAPDARCDTVLTLYDRDRRTVLAEMDDQRDGADNAGELLSWRSPADGIYYLRISSHDPLVYGLSTGYILKIYAPTLGVPGLLTGRVTDAAGNPVPDAVLTTDMGGAAVTDAGGYFMIAAPSGAQRLTLASEGFDRLTISEVEIQGENLLYQDFTLQKSVIPPVIPPVIDPVIDYSLHISLYTESGGRVDSWPRGIDCPPRCTFDFQEDSTVSLTAYGIEGKSLFADWYDADRESMLSDSPEIDIRMDGDRMIIARFSPPPTAGIPGTLKGRVTDISGKGIPDVSLTSDLGGDARTDAGGFYLMDAPSGNQTITLTKEGFLPKRVPDVEISQESITVLDFTMERSGGNQPEEDRVAVTGQIRNESGEGIPGARISFGTEAAIADENGIFRILLTPAAYTVSLIAAGYEPAHIRGVEIIRGTDPEMNFSLVRSDNDLIADAGPDMEVLEGETVFLFGSAAKGEDESEIVFLWEQISGPHAVLSDPTAENPTFVTPIVEEASQDLRFRLTAFGNGGEIAGDEVKITVLDNGISLFPDDVISFRTCTGRPLGIRLLGEGGVTAIECIHSSEIEDTYQRPWNLIYGLVEVRVLPKGDGPGAITVFFPEPAWYGDRPYDCFTYDEEKGWRERRDAEFNGNRDRMTLPLNSGENDRMNVSPNGAAEEIRTRFATGIVYEEEAVSGNGGGCFIRRAGN